MWSSVVVAKATAFFLENRKDSLKHQKHVGIVYVSGAPELTKDLLIKVLGYKCHHGCWRIIGTDSHSSIYA